LFIRDKTHSSEWSVCPVSWAMFVYIYTRVSICEQVIWLTHTWHDSLIRIVYCFVSWVIYVYMCIYMYVYIWTGNMTHSYVTSLTHQNNLIVPCPGLCMYIPIHVCVYMSRWHDSFIRDTLTHQNSLSVPCLELRGVWYRHHWICFIRVVYIEFELDWYICSTLLHWYI